MVTKELVDFVRGEFAKGTTRAELMTLLMSQGWAALDTQEAFNAATEPVAVVPQNPVASVNPMVTMPQSPAASASLQKSSSGMFVYVAISVLVVFIGIGGAYLWYGNDSIKNLFKGKQAEVESSGILFNNINVVEGTKVEYSTPVVSSTISSESVSEVKTAQPAAVADFDKDAVITGVLASQTVMKSQDIVKIRAFLLSKATTSAQKKQISDTSDKDLLFGISLIGALQVEVTRDILESPDTIFSKKSENLVEINFYPKNSSSKATITATKINGVWY